MNIDVPKVYAASKIEQKTTEAPSSVTIITSDDVKRYGYRTLADILRSVPGFNVSYDRDYAFLGVRGVSLGDFNSRILLLVNGHRVNNNLTDGALIDTAFILDVDLIDRCSELAVGEHSEDLKRIGRTEIGRDHPPIRAVAQVPLIVHLGARPVPRLVLDDREHEVATALANVGGGV